MSFASPAGPKSENIESACLSVLATVDDADDIDDGTWSLDADAEDDVERKESNGEVPAPSDDVILVVFEVVDPEKSRGTGMSDGRSKEETRDEPELSSLDSLRLRRFF